ncbi:four-carbon acid sugar kinase family protein [Halalkalibaculum sp. DA384]|uniref:four-carbon acid sugar kinase family protein n=1 Tax=Halalkalibaculum sp. DA384 TaxID=3373606 RepID=UPI003754FD85
MNNQMTIEEQIRQWQSNSPDSRLVRQIRKENEKLDRTLVVLDDDPTGTQTVHDLPVVTSWDEELLAELFREKTPIFYVLTNSRSLNAEQARDLIATIARNLTAVSESTGRDYSVILRSDSTLRGHHPAEMDALIETIGKEPDLKVLHPAFIEGGRLTFNGVHYAGEDGRYLPCGETEYAQDPTFGYTSSHLSDWIIEKTGGRVSSDQVVCLSIDRIRNNSVEDLARQIQLISKGNYLVVDALSYHDIDKFCLALLKSKRSFVARTAASFVASMGGIEQRPLLSAEELAYHSGYGGLIIAGSFVEKTTRQLNKLIEQADIRHKVLDVKQLLQTEDRERLLQEWVKTTQRYIEDNQDLLIYTSREVVTTDEVNKHLDIGKRISTFISDLVRALPVTPSFLIAKGGITSSDIATEALNVKKARIMGQILPGIPVWELGSESKYPGMPYIIFPGNVGGDEALVDALRRIKGEEI